MALTWQLTLHDAMSGPANKAAKSLGKVASGLKDVRRESRATDAVGKQLGSMKGGGGFGANLAAGLKGGIGKLAKGGLDSMKSMVGNLGANLVSSLTSGVMSALGAGLAFSWDQILNIADLQGFKGSTMFALETLLKSKDAADAAYRKAAATSQKIGADFRESMSQNQSLLAQGFSVDFADEIIRAMADLKAINPVANMDGIVRAISQIKSTGRLQGDELMQLAEAGVNIDAVYKKIAKSLGIVDKNGKSATEQVRKLQEAGKIKSDVAINAIMASMKDMVGGKDFGEVAAAKASGSIGGLIAKLMNLKDQILSNIKIDWSPISRGIERLMEAMQSPAGQKFFAAIGDGLTSVLGRLDKISSSDLEGLFNFGAEGVTTYFNGLGTMLDILIELRPVIQAAGGAILWMMGAWVTFLGKVKSGIKVLKHFNLNDTLSGINDWVMAIPDKLMGVLSSIGDFLAGIGETIVGAGASVWGFLTSIVDGIVDTISTVQSQATTLGTSIIDGIVSGIESGASSVVSAIVGVATGAINAAKDTLGISSPSKAFEDAYAWVGPGSVKGIEKGTPAVNQAAEEQARRSVQAVRSVQSGGAQVRTAMTTTSTSTSKVIHLGGLTVNSKSDKPGQVASETVNQLQEVADANG